MISPNFIQTNSYNILVLSKKLAHLPTVIFAENSRIENILVYGSMINKVKMQEKIHKAWNSKTFTFALTFYM